MHSDKINEAIEIMRNSGGIALLIDNNTDQEWERSYKDMLNLIETLPIHSGDYTLIVEL